ncbi:hypothetical protein A1359_18150 [Methylomonas lenta]|uniref:Uncharacterized protein n=1 Tax=Methylomonas lenta TaxID=980561 RepID=A0A177MYB2_9GAMM|nr:hypothetical protein A1359_18150 [Methylomonas lenta]
MRLGNCYSIAANITRSHLIIQIQQKKTRYRIQAVLYEESEPSLAVILTYPNFILALKNSKDFQRLFKTF